MDFTKGIVIFAFLQRAKCSKIDATHIYKVSKYEATANSQLG